MSLLEEGER